MRSKRVLIYGAGGHAKVVAEIIRLCGDEVCGFIDNVNPMRKGEEFYGSTVLGGDEVLESLLAEGVRTCVIGFGDNRKRLEIAERLTGLGFSFAVACHPNATCAGGVKVGEGTAIASGVVIGPSSNVGRHVIINTQASLDHDCIAHDGVHVGPGVVVTGGVELGKCAWIGAGAVVLDHKTIGNGSIVGAGAVVVKDVPSGVVVIGVPARIVRDVEA